MAEPTGLPSVPPGLPPAVSITVIILTTVVSLGPSLLRTFSELGGRGRVFKREKERLDLLKLRYEIEAFKREKSLPDLTEPSLAFADKSARTPPAAATPVLAPSFLSRFVSGTMGAAIPYVLFVFMEVFRHDYRMISKWGAAFPVLSLIAGGIVTLIPRRQANRLICFLVGLSITLFLQLLMQRAVEASPDVLIKGKVVIDGESYARSGVTIRTLPPGREAVILEDGTFVIQLQSERTYQLVAQAPSFSSEIISVDVKRDKNQPVTFRLQKLSPYAPTLPPLKPLPTASGAPP